MQAGPHVTCNRPSVRAGCMAGMRTQEAAADYRELLQPRAANHPSPSRCQELQGCACFTFLDRGWMRREEKESLHPHPGGYPCRTQHSTHRRSQKPPTGPGTPWVPGWGKERCRAPSCAYGDAGLAPMQDVFNCSAVLLGGCLDDGHGSTPARYRHSSWKKLVWCGI